MSIKNDRWIREQAIKGMIEPFEPDQVRYQNDEKQSIRNPDCFSFI